MKKDIPIRLVENVAIAVVPERGEAESDLWEVYIINLKDDPIDHVIVSSTGFGTIEGNAVKTSTLRQHFDSIGPRSYRKLELMKRELFQLAHQFWVSFLYDDFLFDKKYTFVKGSLDVEHFTRIPLLEQQGVMIK
ncbi:MAG: hypothetical protein D6730_14825 [Bacteroidetes bacterium]|nr:MAG: hypothetical protein D6730_14825 [Bacteroidota bacterium]